MPPKSKRSINGYLNYCKRNDKRPRSDDDDCENQDPELSFREMNDSLGEIKLDENANVKTFKDQGTQTDWSDDDDFYKPNKTYDTLLRKKFSFDNIRDFICILCDSIENFNSRHRRILSVLIYLLLRLVSIQFRVCRDILGQLNLLSIQYCHSWLLTIIDEDDLCVILRDKRGNYKRIKFYDNFPDLEKEAKAYAVFRANEKNSSFTVNELASFVNRRFRELNEDLIQNMQLEPDQLVRSEESCRIDLLKWGARFEKNSNRPYFEGHEREDVVNARKQFLDFFEDRKDHYFYPQYISNGLCWNIPCRKIRIILSHDESTFKSGRYITYRPKPF